MRYSQTLISMKMAGVIAATATMFAISPAAKVAAESPSLEGSWSGGGRIIFPSGESERARCRARFQRQGGESFGMSAVCATASARVQQSAQITRISGNRYRGEFHNQEYGLSGSIRIVVNGDSIDASLSGGGGSAQLSLSR
ncbi:MAG: hypothetical protein R3D67_03930 [Hyphomicrobiaceae bacterium]